MNKERINIPVMRHFEDVDDLKQGRDNELIPGQEKVAIPFAKEIYAEIKQEDKKAVMFVCSSRKRSIQTADLISEQIKQIDNTIKLRVVAENGLTNINQGKFTLPSDYKPGDPFVGLDFANRIFSKEVFAPEGGNYLYRFGDPLLQANGSYKYPELAAYFKEYGENYRDFLLRIYELVEKTYEKADKFNSKTKVVAITHAQLYQIFRDLSTVADMVKNDHLEIKPGELPNLCWSLYSKRFKTEKPTYNLNHISIESLYEPEIMGILKKEIKHLKNLK